MVIHGLNKTTLLDFPGHLACTVFTGYCNLRCPFCQNGELVLCPESQPAIPEEEFFDFLDTKYPQVPNAIAQEKVISEDTEASLKKALEEFTADFK